MYVGRFLVVAPEVGAYRVSSRSFPNRRAVERDGAVTVEPTPEAPPSDNPYISYNCLRRTDRGVVVGNGSHVDPVAEKLALGTPARDALAGPLAALGTAALGHRLPPRPGSALLGAPRARFLPPRPHRRNRPRPRQHIRALSQ